MLFKHAFHAPIARGEITVTYRRWKRPGARPGGRYLIDANGVIEVTSVDVIDGRAITDAHARASGFADAAGLIRQLDRFNDADARIYRVTFHYIREGDQRAQLAADDRLTEDDAAVIIDRLARMDASSRHGPWTHATLSLIKAHPATLAATLARRIGRETLPFKADVRKLKALGLTISLETGYQPSPRGRAILGCFED
ncbi:MAG: ASCH domain-containing protein [Dehalococcoidia bacterium]